MKNNLIKLFLALLLGHFSLVQAVDLIEDLDKIPSYFQPECYQYIGEIEAEKLTKDQVYLLKVTS